MYDGRVSSIYTILLRKSILEPLLEALHFCILPLVFEWKRRFWGARDFSDQKSIFVDRYNEKSIFRKKMSNFRKQLHSSLCSRGALFGHILTPQRGSKSVPQLHGFEWDCFWKFVIFSKSWFFIVPVNQNRLLVWNREHCKNFVFIQKPEEWYNKWSASMGVSKIDFFNKIV